MLQGKTALITGASKGIGAAISRTFAACVPQMNKDLSAYLAAKYETDIASIASLKLNKMVDDVIDDKIDNKWGDNYITFVEIKNAAAPNLNHSCCAGYFYIHQINNIQELQTINSAKLQTISYFGMDEGQLNGLKNLANGEGIDRIVKLGKALDFYYVWDGYNLLDELSRKVFVN